MMRWRRVRRMTAARALGRCEAGASAVEFAIIGGVLVMVLVGILDIGRVLWTQNQIDFLVDRAMRQLLIDPDLTAAELEAGARDGFIAGDPTALNLGLSSETFGGDTYRVVEIEAPFTFFVPVIAGTITLAASRRVPATATSGAGTAMAPAS